MCVIARYIYRVRTFREMLEELEYEGRRMVKTSEELHPYISVCANIQTLDEGSRSPLDALEARGYRMIRRLESSFIMQQCGGSNALTRSIDRILLEEEQPVLDRMLQNTTPSRSCRAMHVFPHRH
jgi:hypothetical protein